MLFKPDTKQGAKDGTAKKSRGRGFVMTLITLAILGGLGYSRLDRLAAAAAAGRMAATARPDLPVPVLAATPRIQDVPVYLDGVGAIRALNTVTVRSQVDGKLIAVNFTEGQDVKKGDVLGEIDPALYQAHVRPGGGQEGAGRGAARQPEASISRATSSSPPPTPAPSSRPTPSARWSPRPRRWSRPTRPRSTMRRRRSATPRSSRRSRDAPACARSTRATSSSAADATGLVIITQLQPIAVWFSLPQQQIVRVNAAASKGPLAVDVFGNDGVTVVDTGTLTGIDNQVDQTTGTLKLKAEFPNAKLQLWPGQFVNVRLKVETLDAGAWWCRPRRCSADPIGTFSYVIGQDNVVSAKPVTVTQQNEHDAVIASGLVADRPRRHHGLCQSVRRRPR